MDDTVAQFMSITDQSAEVAQGCLSMTEGDLMAAVNMLFENPEIANSFNNPPPAASSHVAAATVRPQGASRRPLGRQDNAGVIHIDDDDDNDDADDDANFGFPDDSEDDLEPGPASNAGNLQRIAQESDDAAMARRLQEEMYGGGGGGPGADDVRAPIGRTTETLVAPSGYGGYMGGGIGGDDDDEL